MGSPLELENQADYLARFSAIKRLYGQKGLDRLRHAHVCVVGVGGVGSWTVEALARTGIGRLTLVDLDEVCLSNVNRQLHALTPEVGQPKVQVLKRRIQAISPECQVDALEEFFTPVNAEQILERGFDYVVDAIDHLANKCLLLARCRQKQIPVVTSGGAGGRRDPAAIRGADLAFTEHDRLLQKVRKTLRTEYDFPGPGKAFGIPCIYSIESQVFPARNGSVCSTREPSSELRLNCESGFGTAAFVTGTFGFLAAAQVTNDLTHLANAAE